MPSKKSTRGDTKGDSESKHIKRPPNAFLLFRSQFSKDYHSLHPGLKFKQGRHISPAAAAIWKGMSVEQKETYREQARVIKEEHERKYPGWTCRLKRASKKAKKRSSGGRVHGVTDPTAGEARDRSQKSHAETSKSTSRGECQSGRESSVARPVWASKGQLSEIQLPVVGFLSSEVALGTSDFPLGSPVSSFLSRKTPDSPHRIDSLRATGTVTLSSLDRYLAAPPIDAAVIYPQYPGVTDVAQSNAGDDVHARPFSSPVSLEYQLQIPCEHRFENSSAFTPRLPFTRFNAPPTPWHDISYGSHDNSLTFLGHAYDCGMTHSTLGACSQRGVHSAYSLVGGGDESHPQLTANTPRPPEKTHAAHWESISPAYQDTSQVFTRPVEPSHWQSPTFEQYCFEHERPLRDATNVGVPFSRYRSDFEGLEDVCSIVSSSVYERSDQRGVREGTNVELTFGSLGHPNWR